MIKTKNSMLPELYRELYQKPVMPEPRVHKFVNFEPADVNILKGSIRKVISDF